MPGSKSLTNRALACAMISPRPTRVIGALNSDDIDDGLEVLAAWGAAVSESYEDGTRILTVKGRRHPVSDSLDVKLTGSATWARFLIGLAAVEAYANADLTRQLEITIHARDLLVHRPLVDETFEGILRAIGTDAQNGFSFGPDKMFSMTAGGQTSEGLERPPDGPLYLSLLTDRFVSSQFTSGLLLSAMVTDHGIAVLPPAPGSPSSQYIDMTLSTLRAFGCTTDSDYGGHIVVTPPADPTAKSSPVDYRVEPDASTASYVLAAAAMVPGSTVKVPGLCTETSVQGDTAGMARLLEEAGVAVRSAGVDGLVVHAPSYGLRGLNIDMSQCQDLGQTAAAMALFADSPSTLSGLSSARRKESDRVADTASELNKLGAALHAASSSPSPAAPVARYDDDSLTITPLDKKQVERFELSGATVTLDSHGDHRMAMALGLIGLVIPGVQVEGASCVAKTWPDYWEQMSKSVRPGHSAQTGR